MRNVSSGRVQKDGSQILANAVVIVVVVAVVFGAGHLIAAAETEPLLASGIDKKEEDGHVYQYLTRKFGLN